MSIGVALRAQMSASVGGGGAWRKIGSQRLAAPASSITFSGIDTSYRMFRLTVFIVKDGTASSVLLRLNNDTGSNYVRQRLTGNDSAVAAARAASFFLSGISTVAAGGTFTASVTIAKQLATAPAMLVGRMAYMSSAPGEQLQALGGQWNNTADLISQIDLDCPVGNFAAGTVVVLEAA